MFPVLNKRLCAGLIAAILIFPAGGLAPLAAQEIPNDFTAIVLEKIPAVVAITTKQIIQGQTTLDDFFSPFRSPGLEPAQPQVREALVPAL